MSRTAIVILNYNGERMLQRYLPAVVASCPPDAEVIVADNASTDGSVALLESQFAETVQLIRLDKNWGFAEGYNKALRATPLYPPSRGTSKASPDGRLEGSSMPEYYVLLNSDIEVKEGWLEPMIAYMDTYPEVAACQPKLLSVHDKASFEYAGAAGGLMDRLGYPLCRGRIFDTVEQDRGQYDTDCELLWATGACLMIRSEDYWSVGGLDGRFFAHNEEIDLCWRLRIRGRKIRCVTESKVWHVGGGTLPKANPMKTYLNFRNNLTMLYKCLPDSELKAVMRWRTVLDYIAALQMLILKRNLADFKAVMKARRDFKKWRADFAKDRAEIQNWRTKNSQAKPQTSNLKPQTSKELLPLSILFQYYVRGRKTFDRLHI